MSWLSALPILAQIVALFVKDYFEKDAVKKAKNQEVISLTKQAFTGDIKDARSKMAAAIDKLGDIK
jgi:hypothetical protein